jgi:hypothetical protein
VEKARTHTGNGTSPRSPPCHSSLLSSRLDLDLGGNRTLSLPSKCDGNKGAGHGATGHRRVRQTFPSVPQGTATLQRDGTAAAGAGRHCLRLPLLRGRSARTSSFRGDASPAQGAAGRDQGHPRSAWCGEPRRPSSGDVLGLPVHHRGAPVAVARAARQWPDPAGRRPLPLPGVRGPVRQHRGHRGLRDDRHALRAPVRRHRRPAREDPAKDPFTDSPCGDPPRGPREQNRALCAPPGRWGCQRSHAHRPGLQVGITSRT